MYVDERSHRPSATSFKCEKLGGGGSGGDSDDDDHDDGRRRRKLFDLI